MAAMMTNEEAVNSANGNDGEMKYSVVAMWLTNENNIAIEIVVNENGNNNESQMTVLANEEMTYRKCPYGMW
jgi:hypothetical protein